MLFITVSGTGGHNADFVFVLLSLNTDGYVNHT